MSFSVKKEGINNVKSKWRDYFHIFMNIPWVISRVIVDDNQMFRGRNLLPSAVAR
jgi:hypothetical protein